MPMQRSILRSTLFLGTLLLLVGGYLWLQEKPVYWPGYLAMMVFYVLIFAVGNYAAQRRKTEDSTELLLAGRSLPIFLAVFTMSATWIGGGYINGTAEYAATAGLVWVQAPWGYAISLIIGGLIFAGPMRRAGYHTMLDPLEAKFGKKATALFFLPALTGEIFWTAAILTALGTTFGTVLGLDTDSAIILSAIIAISYTAIGGLWAVAFTDVIQLTLLALGLFLVVPIALQSIGGWDQAWSIYTKKWGASASFLPSREALGSSYWLWWDYALLLMFGGVAWQVYFQRVLSAKNAQVAKWLSIGAGVVCLIVAIPASMIGIISSSADWAGMGLTEPPDAASTLPWVVRYLTNPLVATIGLGAIAAAVMSSVDSSILSASSLASWNIYRPLINPNVSSENLGRILKRCIWIIGIAATLLALRVSSVYALWFLCSDFVYCLLFPALTCALFDPKANRYGAVTGFIVAAFLRFGGGESTIGIPPFLPYPMVEDGVVLFPFRTVAMLGNLVVIIVVSRIFRIKIVD